MKLRGAGFFLETLRKINKTKLVAMYYAGYDSRPLSADNEEKTAQAIRGYVYDMPRAEALLL